MQTAIPNAQSGTTDTTVTQYTYDNLNRLHTVIDHHQQQTVYTYDDVGNRESVTYHNGTSTLYVYDSLNRLETMQTVDGSNTIISQFDYTVYPTGHRHTMTDLAGNVSTYLYDDLYRLTQESINHTVLGTITNSYDYDVVGNRQSSTENGVTTTYSYDNNDRLLTGLKNGITTTYSYDDNGNTISQVDNSASIDTSNFSYDARNKLIFVEQLQNGIPSNSIDYQYDVDGNCTQKVDNNGITNFVVDRNQRFAQVVHEMDVQNAIQVTYTHGDDLISQDRTANISYYHYDGLGSTRSLTDFLGQVTDTYDYNAYGTMLDQSRTTDNSYLYTGEQFDSALDNYYLRARYYDLAVGRFTAMDSWMGRTQDPATLHKYLYVHGDPINGIDPSGNATLSQLMFAVNIAATLYTLPDTANEIFMMATDGSEFSAKDVGISVLLSLSGGSGKLIKIINKKLCGKKGCKVPPILDEEHMFHGEIKRPGGKPRGFHSTADPTTTSIIISRGTPLKNGVYEARVGVLNSESGNHKQKNSTMFPDFWSKTMVEAAMYAAWNKNRGRDTGTKVVGKVKIRYFIHNAIWLRGHPVR